MFAVNTIVFSIFIMMQEMGATFFTELGFDKFESNTSASMATTKANKTVLCSITECARGEHCMCIVYNTVHLTVIFVVEATTQPCVKPPSCLWQRLCL